MRCNGFMKNMAQYSITYLGNIRSHVNSRLISVLVNYFHPLTLINYLRKSFSLDSIACLGDLLYYGGVEWLNISDFLGKIKKGLELHAMCFVFKSAVVFLCKERLRQKKKLMVNILFCVCFLTCSPANKELLFNLF